MKGLFGLLLTVIIVVLIFVVVDFDGCGLDVGDRNEDEDTLTTPDEQAAAENRPPNENQQPDLPPRPAGEVAVVGGVDSSLTVIFTEGTPASPGFAASAAGGGLNIQPAITPTAEDVGFVDLCDGRVDIVDSARPVAIEEFDRCQRNGLQLVEFIVGFDAAVLATKNETDVGADCVSLSELNDVYEAGSPIEAWNQIEPFFFPVRLDTAGPVQGTNLFNLTFERILAIPDPTEGDLREDYQAFDEEDPVRREVFKNPKGVLGVFSFSYYGQFEHQLRPLEIDGETGDSCVFPSEETISALLYPFAKGLRLYTTTRSLQRAEVREYLRAYIERAQELAGENDFIPLLSTQQRVQLNRLDNPTDLADPTLVDEAGVIVAYRLPQPAQQGEASEGETTTETTTIGGEGTSQTTTVPAPGTSGTIAEQRAPDVPTESNP